MNKQLIDIDRLPINLMLCVEDDGTTDYQSSLEFTLECQTEYAKGRRGLEEEIEQLQAVIAKQAKKISNLERCSRIEREINEIQADNHRLREDLLVRRNLNLMDQIEELTHP